MTFTTPPGAYEIVDGQAAAVGFGPAQAPARPAPTIPGPRQVIAVVERSVPSNTFDRVRIPAADTLPTMFLVGTLRSYQALQVDVLTPGGLIAHTFRQYTRDGSSARLALPVATFGGDVVITMRVPSAGSTSTFRFDIYGYAGANPAALAPPILTASFGQDAVGAGANSIAEPMALGGQGGTIRGWVSSTQAFEVHIEWCDLDNDYATGQDATFDEVQGSFIGGNSARLGPVEIIAAGLRPYLKNTSGVAANMRIRWQVIPAAIGGGTASDVGIASV